MKLLEYKINNKNTLYYYEVENDKPKLLLLHAQGTNSLSFKNIVPKLSKYYHLYLIDYYGHGKSTHSPEKYNVKSIGDDIISFIKNVIKDNVTILGHSSGGLIATYIAANCERCSKLILEDAPLFSSIGENRYNTYNYKDLSTICHNFISQNEEKDFVYYYFKNQYCWNFFPEDSRENIKEKLCKSALRYRKKHPDKNLKIPFWPKKFLEAFKGIQNYDPYFGEAFYNDSFNNVNYNELLHKIKCKTLFIKANTTIGEDGLVQGALSDKDLQNVINSISNIKIQRINCGHGVHIEKPKQFIKILREFI